MSSDSYAFRLYKLLPLLMLLPVLVLLLLLLYLYTAERRTTPRTTVQTGHQQDNSSSIGNEGLAPLRVAEVCEEKAASSAESSPVRPTLAQSIVFGRSGVEETNNWATFQRPAFRVAHTFVLKPRMSQQEVDAVKAVCKVISQPPDPTANTDGEVFEREIAEASMGISKLHIRDAENRAPPIPLADRRNRGTGASADLARADGGSKAALALLPLHFQR